MDSVTIHSHKVMFYLERRVTIILISYFFLVNTILLITFSNNYGSSTFIFYTILLNILGVLLTLHNVSKTHNSITFTPRDVKGTYKELAFYGTYKDELTATRDGDLVLVTLNGKKYKFYVTDWEYSRLVGFLEQYNKRGVVNY